jgi:murein L,D-transpeptidase YafK
MASVYGISRFSRPDKMGFLLQTGIRFTMLKALLTFLVLGMLPSLVCAQSFLEEQMKFGRVRAALQEKGATIQKTLASQGLKTNEINILIIAYKAEQILEIYAKKRSDTRYNKLISYDICNVSGLLGPKRAVGDFQIPEGFYHINRFNPASSYHLSLGVNYPNNSDRIKSKASDLGGDIFIHGSCVTIGCLPMTNDKIKEIYLYAVYARNNGQTKIPVYIFPFQMQPASLKKYTIRYNDQRELLAFWNNLRRGYDKFEQEKQELKISVDKSGNYLF